MLHSATNSQFQIFESLLSCALSLCPPTFWTSRRARGAAKKPPWQSRLEPALIGDDLVTIDVLMEKNSTITV
jgi:hypothetical protein